MTTARRAATAPPSPSPRLAARRSASGAFASSSSKRWRASSDDVSKRRRAKTAADEDDAAHDARDDDDDDDDDDASRRSKATTRRAFLSAASFAPLLANAASSSVAVAAPASASTSAIASSSLPEQRADALAPSSGARLSPLRASSASSIRIPMTLEGGTYVVRYTIGDASVRGVLDTGSPFVTMDGGCGKYWGCLQESDARPSGYGETYEIYGLQEDGVTKWVLGDVRFEGTEAVDVVVGGGGGEIASPTRACPVSYCVRVLFSRAP
jgi:hypothetical protein